jgi:hypothetical protein
MQARDEIGRYLNEHGLVGEGVEVGVFEGVFSETILNEWQGRRLYLIDTWAVVPGYTPSLGLFDGKDFDAAKAGEIDWLAVRDSCYRRLARFNGRAEMMQMRSIEAAAKFEDGMFDFVYIDGDHSFAAVTLDLFSWYLKLRSGGFFAGHDYLLGTRGKRIRKQGRGMPKFEKVYQVKQAVDAFAKMQDVTVELTSEKDTNITWYWRKP